jgi:hypothetical protein
LFRAEFSGTDQGSGFEEVLHGLKHEKDSIATIYAGCLASKICFPSSRAH